MRPSLDVRLSWLDHASPRVRDLALQAQRPLVAVPLLLSTGYHVRHDIPQAVSVAPVRVMIARRLGPHPLLVDALVDRLAEAGWTGGPARLVLVAAGSSHAAARRDVDELTGLVGRAAGRAGRRGLRRRRAVRRRGGRCRGSGTGPVVVVNYLLSPGQFADKVARLRRRPRPGTARRPPRRGPADPRALRRGGSCRGHPCSGIVTGLVTVW